MCWNKVQPDIFCTVFEKSLKIWDFKKLGENTEILQKDLGQDTIKQIQFDPVRGSLLMTQDPNNLRLYRTQDMQFIDEMTVRKQVATRHNQKQKAIKSVQFLDIKGMQQPGIVLLNEHSTKFNVLSVEESAAFDADNDLSQQADESQPWKLKIARKYQYSAQQGLSKNDKMGDRRHDVNSFTIRQENGFYQIISTCVFVQSFKIQNISERTISHFKDTIVSCWAETA